MTIDHLQFYMLHLSPSAFSNCEFADMAQPTWDKRRPEMIKHIEKISDNTGEYLKLLVEADMKNTAPLRTMMPFGKIATGPKHRGTDKGNTKEPTGTPMANTCAEKQRRAVRKTAVEGKNQKKEQVQLWRQRVATHIDTLLQERKEDDWYAEKYWGTTPDKVRRAERNYMEYVSLLAEFLPVAGTRKGNANFALLSCNLCGEIIIEKKCTTKSMDEHNHYAHWTEL